MPPGSLVCIERAVFLPLLKFPIKFNALGFKDETPLVRAVDLEKL
jgi:hypothetical protein